MSRWLSRALHYTPRDGNKINFSRALVPHSCLYWNSHGQFDTDTVPPVSLPPGSTLSPISKPHIRLHVTMLWFADDLPIRSRKRRCSFYSTYIHIERRIWLPGLASNASESPRLPAGVLEPLPCDVGNVAIRLYLGTISSCRIVAKSAELMILL